MHDSDTLRTFSLALNALLNSCMRQRENCRYLVASNKAVPLADLCLLVLGRALPHCKQQPSTTGKDIVTDSAALCGPLLQLLASIVSTLALQEEETAVVQQVTDAIRYQMKCQLC